MKLLRVLMLLMLAAPGLCQPEDEPYFSLSSNRIPLANIACHKPGENRKPRIGNLPRLKQALAKAARTRIF